MQRILFASPISSSPRRSAILATKSRCFQGRHGLEPQLAVQSCAAQATEAVAGLSTAKRQTSSVALGSSARLAIVLLAFDRANAQWDPRRPRQYAKPVLCEPGEFWLYAPAAVERAPIEPQKRSIESRFRLWRDQGYLHCHAFSMTQPLVLPVFTSDGCGYPNLSTVLRALKDGKSVRWGIFKRYLALAARCDGEPRPHERDAMKATLAKFQKMALDCDGASSKKLDTRYDIEDTSREWVLVLHQDSAELDDTNIHE
eukprot:CAMPEP_0115191730 /NCGR_PEP_ID=MMETSP0270-20121206/12679_1 /TAXON_ID=71861 /ORGANISM="Scrippsiella trochoidea, Strain CCMP3099" /LENGTH=256 /DNA_ID=CAMNT_0002604957 /DNA_START=12 /DNA_END=782 /DNA_ORIENTATION=+